jgi:hypothetical protein
MYLSASDQSRHGTLADFNNHFGSEIVRIIVDELNEAYSKFMTKHPDFNGKIAVYALSLGGIAMFDILTCMDDDESEGGDSEQESRTSRSAPHESDHGDSRSTESRGETSSTAKKARARKQDQSKFRAVIPKLKFRPHILFTVGSPVGKEPWFKLLYQELSTVNCGCVVNSFCDHF